MIMKRITTGMLAILILFACSGTSIYAATGDGRPTTSVVSEVNEPSIKKTIETVTNKTSAPPQDKSTMADYQK